MVSNYRKEASVTQGKIIADLYKYLLFLVVFPSIRNVRYNSYKQVTSNFIMRTVPI